MGLRNEEFARSVGYDPALMHLNHLEYLIDVCEKRIVELAEELDMTGWDIVGYEDNGFSRYCEIMGEIRGEVERMYNLKEEYGRLRMVVMYCEEMKNETR